MNGHVRLIEGLTVESALALAAVLPKEPQRRQPPFRVEWFKDPRGRLMSANPAHWESDDLRNEHAAAWKEYGATSPSWEAEHAAWRADYNHRLLTAPRDKESPACDRNEWEFGSLSRSRLWSHLCNPCRAEAKAQADRQHPHSLPVLAASSGATEEEVDALYLCCQASWLISDLWESVVRSWPLCKDCTGIATSTQSKKEVEVLGDRALEALAMYGPMTSGQIVALKIKGINRNTVTGVMRPLVDSGRVVSTPQGTAKLYALAAA